MAAGKLSADPVLQSLALEGEQLDRKAAQRPNLLQLWTLPADMTHLEESSPAVLVVKVAAAAVSDCGGGAVGGWWRWRWWQWWRRLC